MIRHGIFIIIIGIWAMCPLLAVESHADESLKEVKIPQVQKQKPLGPDV